MTEFQKIFHWLKKYKFTNINFDLLDDKEKELKELFYLNVTILYWELCIKRLQELAYGYFSAKTRGHLVNGSLVQRAALETLAVGGNQVIGFMKLSEFGATHEEKVSEAEKQFEEQTKRLFLGMKKLDQADRITAKNILTCLENLDKFLAKQGEYPKDALISIYEDLSNICHPNMPGLMGAYYPKAMEITMNASPHVRTKHDYFEIVLMLAKSLDKIIQALKSEAIPQLRKLDSNVKNGL